jgi:hypothetical protein
VRIRMAVIIVATIFLVWRLASLPNEFYVEHLEGSGYVLGVIAAMAAWTLVERWDER